MDFVTIRDVELCSVGMNWSSAGGKVTLSMEDIGDAAAAWADPHIRAPRLKIGHTDPRFADPEDPGHDPFYDGEPAFGSVHNLRLINDGATLVGDYVNVPAWLAEVLPSAYPSRSIEGTFQASEAPAVDGRRGVETAGGKRYEFVLTACALLGVERPAVADLEDLRYLLTEGQGVIVTGDGEEAGAEGGAALSVSMGGMATPATPTADAALEASVDHIVDVYYDSLPEDPSAEGYWNWVRDVRVDPNALIVDDNGGSLWLIPFSTDGDQVVTFDEPERVLQTYRSAPKATAAVLAAASKSIAPGRIVAAFSTREASVPAARLAPDLGGSPESASISGMDFTDTQRANLCKRLDLAEDATDEQITEALAAEPEAPAEVPAEETPAEETPAAEEAPAADETTVAVDKTVLAELTADAAMGREAREKQIADHREAVLKTALGAGKITPASKSAWETKLKAAPEATEAELAALPENLVPVDREVGHGGSQEVTASGDLDMSEEEILFPNLRGRAAKEGA